MTVVLVVENSKTRRSKISNHIRSSKKSIMVLTTSDAKHALSICKENAPDIAFINNDLPDGIGLELIKKLKAQGVNPYFVLLLDSISKDIMNKAINQTVSDIIFTSDKKNFLNNLNLVFNRFKNFQDHKRYIEMAISGKAFRESDERFQSMIKFSSDIILILRADCSINYISPSVERILGYKSKKLFGKNIFKFIHPKDATEIQKKFADTFQNFGIPISSEIRIKHSNGSWVYFEVIANNLIEDPNIKGVVINARDITKRKSAEEEIKKSEAKYRGLVDDAGAGIASVDPDGNLTYVNRALCKIIGYTEKELIGKNFVEFLHQDDIDVILDLFDAALKKPKNKPELEFRVIHKDGHIVYLQARPTMTFHNKKVSGLNAIATDITERRLAEEAMRVSEERYKLLANNVADIIFILDTDLNFSYVSPSFERFSGYKNEDLSEFGWQDLLTPESLEKAFLFMDDNIIESWFTEESTKEPHFIEMEFNKKDGTAVLVEVNLSALNDENNQLTGILGVARDITNRKKMDDALCEREEKYRLLFDNSTEAIVVTQEGLLKFYNPKALELTRYSQKELSSKPFIELIHPEDRDFVAKLQLKHMKDDEALEMYSFRLIDKKKNVKWVEINEVQINWEDSPATLNFLTDITDRKSAEEALIQSEDRYRVISELISDFVYSIRVEPDGTNVPEWSTDTLQRVMGISHAEMLKKGGWKNFIHPDDLPILEKRYKAFAADKSDVSEYRVVTKTGDVHWVRDYGHPIWDGSQGRIVRIYGAAQDITEQKVAEEELKQSEIRFRQFFENEPGYCYMISPDGWILDVNKAALNALGYKKSELVGKPMNVIYAPECSEKANKMFTKWKKTKKLTDEELVIITKNGARRTVLLSASIVKDKYGKVLHSISVQKDITEYNEAEKALRESEEKFRTLAENSPNMIFINQFGKIVYVNKKCEKVMGYKCKEFYHKDFDFIKLIAPESKATIMKAFKFHREGKEVPTFEYAVLTKDRRKIDAFYTSRMIKYRGAPAILGTILDITDRKRAERALKESEIKYRTLVDNVTEVIIEMDAEGNFSFVSPNIETITGFKPEEVTGKSAFQYIHEDDLENAFDKIDGVFNTHKNYEMEFRTKHKKGHYIWVEGRGNFVKKDGKIKIISSLRDITKRKQSEEALRQSEERFRNLADLLPEGVFETDLNGKFIFANKKAFELSGYSKKDYEKGVYALQMFDKKEQSRVEKNIQLIMSGEELGVQEYVLRRKNGIRLPILIHSNVIIQNGKPIGLRGIIIDISALKQAEEALKESEVKYRNLVEEIDEVIFSVDKKGIMTYMSPAVETLTGYKASEIVEKPFSKFIYKEDIPRALEGFKSVLKGKARPNEYRGVRKSGEIFWIRTFSQPIIEDGKLIGARGTLTDITERKKAEEELTKSEEKYRSLVEQSSQGIVILQGVPPRVVFANKAIADIFGYTIDELLNLSANGLIERVHPEDIPLFKNKYMNRIKGKKEPSHTELRVFHKDGSVKWLECYCKPIKFNGEPAVQATFIDITERKSLEDQLKNKLRESEHLYWLGDGLKYSDTIDDVCNKGLTSICLGFNFKRGILFTLNKAKNCLEYNHARGFNVKNKKIEVLFNKKTDLFNRAVSENNWFIIQNGNVVEGKGKYQISDVITKNFGFPNKRDSYIVAPICSKNNVVGLVVLDSANFDPYSQETNEMLGMYLTTIGIAIENVMLYQELEESFSKLKEIDRMKTEFIDIASHELRTPLASIKIYTDLMLEGYIGNFSKDEKKQLQDMNKNIIDLNNLITEMLDFTRTDKDFFKLSLKSVSLSKLADEIVKRFKHIAETRNIGFKVKSKGDTKVKSDSEMLKKVFTNLISNAIKYSSKGGQIRVEVQDKGNVTQVSVADSGEGIAKKDLPYVFDRFYMGDTSLTREKDQLGLGLSIVKSIVERHGGRIWAESKLGKGSIFNFMIPKQPNMKQKKKNHK